MPLPYALGSALLTTAQSYAADQAAVAAGVESLTLMENACAAIARTVRKRWTPRPTLVLAGPGNNGGDGFGTALLLAGAGWPVTVALLGDIAALRGDAAAMAARWTGPVQPLEPSVLAGHALVIDAVFGAGLGRALDGETRATIEQLAASGVDICAVDVPSGIDGNTGAVLGAAAPARTTVTFHRPKPGHFLLPGRTLTGDLVVADIGIPNSALAAIQPETWANGPDQWCDLIPWPDLASHKYRRGHGLVVGGPASASGAARLAAHAALGVGAGLVTVAMPSDATAVYGAHLTSVMTRAADNPSSFDALLADNRKNAVVIGPGCGVNAVTRDRTLAAIDAGKACVIDADALTVFADRPDDLFERLSDRCVLTPHDGEYDRLFECDGDRLTRARHAAAQAGAVVVLKGGDTVIAAPDGRAAINFNAPPSLATAGAGDVLAGLIGGLLAQGLPALAAACAGTWIHGAAAKRLGQGLISEALTTTLPAVLTELAGQTADE